MLAFGSLPVNAVTAGQTVTVLTGADTHPQTLRCAIAADSRGGATGTSRHLTEEVAYVIEGTGYDHHFDVRFDCKDEFVWEWDKTPKKVSWGPGDFIYIPPYCAHKRFNSGSTEARIPSSLPSGNGGKL